MPAARKAHWFLALAVIFFGSTTRAAIVVTSTNRIVETSVTYAGDTYSDSDSSIVEGFFLGQAESGVSDGDDQVSALAHQSSHVGVSFLSGNGDASVFADVESESTYSSLARSFFDVEFTVTTNGTYELVATANWIGNTEEYDGFAKVTFVDPTLEDPLTTVVINGPGHQTLDTNTLSLELAAGVAYQLTAEIKFVGAGNPNGPFAGNGTWTVSLSPVSLSPTESVPEPASLALWSLGALNCAVAGYRRRKLA